MDLYSFSINVDGKDRDMRALCINGEYFLRVDKLMAACGASKKLIERVRDKYMMSPMGIMDAQDSRSIYIDPNSLFRVLPTCKGEKETPADCIDTMNVMRKLNTVLDAVTFAINHSDDSSDNDDNDNEDDEILFHDIAVSTRTGLSIIHAGLVNEKDYVVECLSLLRAAGITPERWECLKDRLPFQKLSRITIDVEDGDFAIPLFYGAPNDYIGFVDEILDVADHCRDDACSKDMNALARNMEFLLENLPAAFKSADEYIGCWYEFPDFIDEEYGLDEDSEDKD